MKFCTPALKLFLWWDFSFIVFVFPDAEVEEPIEAEAPTVNETTLVTNEEAAFALEPVAITRMQLNLWSINLMSPVCLEILILFYRET